MQEDPSPVHTLRQSTLAAEGPLFVSKLLTHQLLIDSQEMRSLFDALTPCAIYIVDRLLPLRQGEVSLEAFLEGYERYISALKKGILPEESLLKKHLQAALSCTNELLYSIRVETAQEILKANRPLVMMQPHRMTYSLDDGKFRPMLLGSEGILWGVQFSYPQIYQNPKTMTVYKVDESPTFPNTQLFKKLQRWIRYNTQPTRFLTPNKEIAIPMRIGPACLPWINNHPQLKAKGLHVCNQV